MRDVPDRATKLWFIMQRMTLEIAALWLLGRRQQLCHEQKQALVAIRPEGR